MLAHLFDGFVKKELEHQEAGLIRFGDDLPEKPESVKSRTQEEKLVAAETTLPPIHIPPPPPTEQDGPKLPSTAVTTNPNLSSYLPNSTHNQLLNGPYTAPLVTTNQPDYFSGAHHSPIRRESSVQLPPAAALPTSPLSPTGGNFMNRLKNLSVKAKLTRVPTNEDKLPTTESLAPSTSSNLQTEEQQNAEKEAAEKAAAATAAATAMAEAKAIEDAKLKEIEESKSESYTPPQLEDFPPLHIPSSTMIIVAEESAEASTCMDLYRGTVGSTGQDADTIIDVAPAWLLSYLLYVSYTNHIYLFVVFTL